MKMVERVRGKGVEVEMWEVGMKGGMRRKGKKLVVGGWGRGKCLLMKEVVGEYYEEGGDVVLVERGKWYEGLWGMMGGKRGGGEGVYLR